MAIHRGIQSAIFYYLSCAPCADARYRKRRKQEAVWDRAAREALAAELPNAYRHPSPSSTNPHWQTEIALGPRGIHRPKKKTNGNSEPRGRGIKKTPTGLNSNTSGTTSEIELPQDEKDGDRWNFRPYQRDDDELWGSANNLDGVLSDTAGLQVPQRARTKDSTSSQTYQPSRNPPISDLHPATVTKVSSREEVMWMMQPPPVAEVMNGKERASRSRSDSGGSRLQSPALSATSLSRQVSSRLMERKMRGGEASATAMSRESSSRTSTTTYNNHVQHTTTQLSFTSTAERDFALDPASTSTRESSEDSNQTILHNQRPSQPHRIASRPQLSTITSSSEVPTTDRAPTPTDLPELVNENSIPTPPQSRDSDTAATTVVRRTDKEDRMLPPPMIHRHSASILVKSGKELRLLQAERSPPRPKTTSTDNRRRAADDEDDEDEEAILTSTLETNPKAAAELFDSWYTPDFELGTWVLEHTKREGVRERWSMEF